ncbi:hypothetical protein SKDZ_10G2850 [Saccharomyces kudriavzevii ZP591]|nr:hypothetical protein SKDZ_10G2850 [Saccharomyces kudriavzevii ZP591]
MNDKIDKMEERYSMTKLENRLKTFRDGVVLQKKKLKWSFKVIPYQAMAKLGFYFDPVIDPMTSKLKKDSVRCCYCHRRTYSVRDCRSKKKNVLETLSNIMMKHLTDPDNNQVCLLIYLRNKLLTDYSFHMGVSDWKNDKYFSNPDNENVLHLRRFTFENNWPHGISQNECQLNVESMVNAGLIRYDSSIDGLNDPNVDKALMNDSCYCIYCKQSLQGWSLHDDPVRRHYEISKSGNCYFFQTRNRFENMRNTKGSSNDASNIISRNVEVSTTSDEEEKEEVIAVKSTSQSQNFVLNSSSSSTDPHSNDGNQSNNSVIQHRMSTLNGKEDDAKEKEQINLENENATLEGHTRCHGISVDERDVILTPNVKEDKRPNLQGMQLSSPIRKRRKLKRISPRKIFDEDDSENSVKNTTVGTDDKDKDLIIDFTGHINKTRDVGRKNAILDDSADEFSFSNQGHSTFDIPIPTSSHLFRDISSDNNNGTQEDNTDANVDVKEADLKEKEYSVNTAENEVVGDTKLIGGDSNINILKRTQVKDRNPSDVNTDKGSFNRTNDLSETPDLNKNNVEKAEAHIRDSQYKSDTTVPVRRAWDTTHSDELNSETNDNTTHTSREEVNIPNFETSDVRMTKKDIIDVVPKAVKELAELHSLPSNEQTIQRKLDNINIDLSLSASDFSSSSNSERSSKNSSAISTPVASPKINLTRSLHTDEEFSGFSGNPANNEDFTNKRETIKTVEYPCVKNEISSNELPIFETGTPIASQENESRKLFDDDFFGKGLDPPFDSSTVEINKAPKSGSALIPSAVGSSTSDTNLLPEYSLLEKQEKEINSNSDKRTVSFLSDDNKKLRVDLGEWCKIDENRLLVKNYFHDLLKYINLNDATLANDKDGDLAFLIKQMPNEELDMTFIAWVNMKVQSIKREFVDDCDKKLGILRNDFDTATNYIETLEDDDELIEIAKKMGIF